MNHDSKEKSRILVQLAELYGESLTDSRLAVYLSALRTLTPKEINVAAQRIFKNPMIRRMPLPADFHEILNPQMSDKDVARVEITKIYEAVRKFGWPNSKEAREFLGEVTWSHIERIGGWSKVCQDDIASPSNVSGYARLRDNIEVSQKHGEVPLELEGMDNALKLIDDRDSTNND